LGETLSANRDHSQIGQEGATVKNTGSRSLRADAQASLQDIPLVEDIVMTTLDAGGEPLW
jgi:hypothetical protein